MTAAELVQRLEGAKQIHGGWSCRCPAHEDHRQSLSVSQGEGKILLKCHAGCECGDIVSALGLEMRDLFTVSDAPPRNGTHRAAPQKPAALPLSASTVEEMHQALRADPEAWRHVTEALRFSPDVVGELRLGLCSVGGRRWLAYPYRRRDGWSFANCRSIDGDKDFLRMPSGQPTTLYRGEQLEDGGVAVVFEGERDAAAALSLSLAAEVDERLAVVAIPGVNQARIAVEALRRQSRVYLATDGDGPGDKAAADIAAGLEGVDCRRVKFEGFKDLGDLLSAKGAEEGRGLARDAFRAADQKATKTRLLSASEIFAPLPPVNWICNAIDAAPGAPMLVAGYGFSGKTVAMQDFALAVATGGLAWGRFRVRRGRVLHLDYEQGAYLSRARYQRLARGRGIDPAALEGRLVLAPFPGWYLDADASDEFSRLVDGFDFVLVDSFRAACPTTDENSSEARIPLDRLTRVSERSGVFASVIHHARKPTKDAQGGAKMTVRGSGALFDACGSVLVFGAAKGEPATVTHEKARITGKPHPDFHLEIEDVPEEGDPTAGLRVSVVEVAAEDEPRKRSPADRYAEAVEKVRLFVRSTGPVTGGANLIRAKLGLRKDDVCAALDDLIRQGEVVRGGTYKAPIFSVPGAQGTD